MTGAAVLNTHCHVVGVEHVAIFKVLDLAEALSSTIPPERILLFDSLPDERFAGVFSSGEQAAGGRVSVSGPRDKAVIQPGDVIRLRAGSSLVSVLYRRGSRANSLFITERCNSLCLMCSQPPRADDDSWRIAELLETIPLIDPSEIQLGITGGEPTLLGDDLARVLAACRSYLPDTHLHVLTNGRLFADRRLADTLVAAGGQSTTWAVPVYADVPEIHDRIVDSENAFAETMLGLYELARLGARVEIRIVLHALSIPRLQQLAAFIYRRLPFAEHVALMGLEPMGFAKRNRDLLWIDPVDYIHELSGATHFLGNRGMTTSIYNLPLCILPESLWPYARQSISDWKNRLAPECIGCEAQDKCAGFFASAGPTWRSRAVAPIRTREIAHEMA